MLDRLSLPELPVLRGDRVILRPGRDSDIDDRLAHPIDPEEEDAYGSSWRREWDGRRYHALDQHRATYSAGLFVAALRGCGLGREITRLVLDWAFGPPGAHRVRLEVLAGVASTS